MRVGFRNVRFLQEGGAMPAEDSGMAPEAAPMPELGGAIPQELDPLMQIAQMAMLALQGQDCNAAMQVCEAFVLIIQQQQGDELAAAPQGEPVYRRGGSLVRRVRN